MLKVVEEPVSTVIDNFDKAEKFGWIGSVDEWLLVRQLRNQMIHDYIEEPSLLADALNAGHQNVDLLKNSAQKMIAEARRRMRDTQE